jgi:excinuclease ABC subunit A
MKKITIKNAHAHNLKNLDLSIPRNQLIVITGPSGSGKSSLAFDTIYQEGQRRYLESLVSFGKSFMPPTMAVSVDYIDGLSPTLSLDQKTTSYSKRSTVGSLTEISDFTRMLFAKCAVAYSPFSGKPIIARSVQEITQEICSIKEGSKLYLMANILWKKKGEHKEVFAKCDARGIQQIRVNGEFITLANKIKLPSGKENIVDAVVDRIILDKSKFSRIEKAVLECLRLDPSGVWIFNSTTQSEHYFSTTYYCPDAQVSFPVPTPLIFSYNSNHGACDQCLGLGDIAEISESKIIENSNETIDGQYNFS